MDDIQKKLAQQMQALDRETFESKNLDPWVRVDTDPYQAGRRDAFIGNGLIGLRVPPEGEPSVYPTFSSAKAAPGGTLMYGLWNADGLVPVLNFMGLKLGKGRMVFRRDSGAIMNYSQKLDWRTGTVTTECDWFHWAEARTGGKVHIVTTTYLPRTQKHAGVVEMELTANYDTVFVLSDIIDGAFIPGIKDVNFHFRSIGAIPKVVCADIAGHKVAAASAIMIDGEPQAGMVTPSAAGFKREVYCPVKNGVTVRIVKCAAMYMDSQTSDPINTAAVTAVSVMENLATIRSQHEAAWAKIWENRIEIDHPGVQMLINNGLYQLYCNLDEAGASGVPGPCGLSCNAWFGHIFHDADTWTLPPIALLNPGMAKNYVRYRVDTLDGARRNAAAQGLPGALYAWESGEFGDELIPGLVYCKQLHINGDVMLALWRYYLSSGDEECLRQEITPAICAIADYFAARAVYNSEQDRYELHGVCCPDEFSGIVNNNAFTNYGAIQSLNLAVALSRRFGLPENPQWRTVAEKMWLPLDEEKKIVVEYEGYNGQIIKQADAILLFYPFTADLPEEYKRNTNAYYQDKYPTQKIIMSSAIHGIVAAELGNSDESWAMLMDLLPHFRGKFLITSESALNETHSLLTGIGGMLQLFLMGWAGIRMDEKEFKAEAHLPQQINTFNVYGIHYKGEVYDLKLTHDSTQVIKRAK